VTTDLAQTEKNRIAAAQEQYTHHDEQQVVVVATNNLTTMTTHGGSDLTIPISPTPTGATATSSRARGGEDGNSRSSETKTAIKKSWIVRHRHWLRGVPVQRLIIVIVVVYVFIAVATLPNAMSSDIGATCNDTNQLITLRQIAIIVGHSVVLLPFVLVFIPIMWRLQRYEHDAFKMMTEFQYSSIVMVLFVPLGFIHLALNTQHQETYLLVSASHTQCPELSITDVIVLFI
jgi:hypothetical protein